MLLAVLCITILHFRTSNAYKTRIVNISDCLVPDLPYAPYSPFSLQIEVFSKLGKKLLRGNLTAKEDIPNGNKEGTFRWGLVKADGKKKLEKVKWIYSMKHLKCRSFVARAIFTNLGIPYMKTCSLKKGVYPISDVDVDVIDKAFKGVVVRSYGLYVSETEIQSGKESLGCWTVYVYVGPDKA